MCEQRITVSIMGCEPLAHHILGVFDPEAVSGFLCEQCRTQSCATHPAIRRQTLLSLPRFLRINVTAPLTPDGFPMDFHQHGPFREFERLDLSRLAPSPQCEQAHYTLRAAIMYSKRHHWAYLQGHTPIFVSDATDRVATPADLQMVALCDS